MQGLFCINFPWYGPNDGVSLMQTREGTVRLKRKRMRKMMRRRRTRIRHRRRHQVSVRQARKKAAMPRSEKGRGRPPTAVVGAVHCLRLCRSS